MDLPSYYKPIQDFETPRQFVVELLAGELSQVALDFMFDAPAEFQRVSLVLNVGIIVGKLGRDMATAHPDVDVKDLRAGAQAGLHDLLVVLHQMSHSDLRNLIRKIEPKPGESRE